MSDNIRLGVRVGAIIPVFNRSAELQVLLDSLQNQTFMQGGGILGILVVDNGSTDGGTEKVFPDNVTVLRLPENVGACGGFNRGMQHMLARGGYDYLWLLDSDLWAAPDALAQLVAATEADPSIGLAGSLIVNSRDHNVVVEAGAMIELSHGSVRPILCNEPLRNIEQVLTVDYVGSGVSLIRVEAARQAGYYDERYHFLWEDMDYGLYMKHCGWRVVAITGSVVYHPPFTEKRSASLDAYYGVRNPMVTISKYSGILARVPALHNFLRRACKGLVFRLLNGVKSLSMLTWFALYDFVAGRLGSMSRRMITEEALSDAHGAEIRVESRPYIILPSGNHQTITAVIEYLKKNGGGAVTLVIQQYRAALFRDLQIDRTILYNDKSPRLFFEHLRVFLKLLATPGVIINPDPLRGSPFTYAHSEVATWDADGRRLRDSRETLSSLWKLAVAVLAGELLALLLLAPILVRSYCLKPKRFDSED